MTSIAVLGGGLSGLSAAFHLATRFPNNRITLLEKQSKLGGWLTSTRVHGGVLLEAGPRTLRPNAKSVLELINLLHLQDQLITVHKSAPAAKSRYIYNNHRLLKIPSTTREFLYSPLTPLLIPAILNEAFTLNNRPAAADESVDALLTRRFGPDFARVFGSALVHGIYASDSRHLSVQSAFPALWELEDAGGGSITRGGLVRAFKDWFNPKKKKDDEEYKVGNVDKLMTDVSVYSFKNGVQTLTDALHADLARRPNVSIIPNAPVNAISKLHPGTFQITHSHSHTLYASHIVSSLPPHTLHPLLRPSPALPLPPHVTARLLLANPRATVHVLNLVFPCAPKHIHPMGFGYLVPRPPADYASTPPATPGVLGVVFDSCAMYPQDAGGGGMTPEEYYERGAVTKMTVMLGGPYALPFNISSSSSVDPPPPEITSIPPEITSILTTLSTHLSRTLPPPTYWASHVHQECIPTLLPGHRGRVEELRALIEGMGGGVTGEGMGGGATGIKLVGAGVDGVSVGDCVNSGRTAARGLVV